MAIDNSLLALEFLLPFLHSGLKGLMQVKSKSADN